MQRLAASSLLRLSTCSLRPGLLSDRAITYSTRPIFDLIPSKPLTARQKDKERNRLRSVSADMRPTDASTPEKRWESYVEVIQNPISRSEPGPQLAPTMTIFKGRSVRVFDGRVGKAFMILDRVLKKNQVWEEVRLTSRHEQKGMKRRRLRSLRWRQRFSRAVGAKVQLVKMIRRRKT